MIDKVLLKELQEYVDRRSLNIAASFGIKRLDDKSVICEKSICYKYSVRKSVKDNELEDFINNNRQSKFNQVLFDFIDKKELNDADVYKRAGIDRRHFSKIRSNVDYKPGKNTVIALGIALELDKKEMNELLSSAGFSLSNNDTLDLVVQFFLEKKMYDIDDINLALDYFSLKPLTGVLE